MRRVLLASALGTTLVLAVPHPARADVSTPTAADKETGRALFAEGLRALEAHDYVSAERACGGARALVRVPTASECWGRALEGLGRLVEARDAFSEAGHFPLRPDEPAVFTSARTAAQAEAEADSKRIPSILVVVTGPSESAPLRVTIDGAALALETARLERKVNPGRHTVIVAAVGFESATVDVDVAEGEERRVPVALRPADTEPTRQSAETPSTATGAREGSQSTGVGPAVWTTFGIGAAGLAVGSTAGVLAVVDASSAKNHCAGTICTPEAQGSINGAKTWATVADVGLVVAGVGATVGVGLLLLATSPTKTTAGTRTSLTIGLGSLNIGSTW